jgi:hypothetical protein
LNTGDPTIDSEDGNPIVYEAILQEMQKFENRPIFLKEDCEQIVSDPIWSEKVPEWMEITKQVATGNRRRVLEDGHDKMNSDHEEIEDMKPDEEPNAYPPGMDPSKGPVMLSSAQATAQRAAAQAQNRLRVPPRSQSQIGGSSDDDDPDGSENVWSQSKGYFRRNKNWRAPKAASQLALPAPDTQKALPAPNSQLALPAPDRQKALSAPDRQKALPAPEPMKAQFLPQEKSVPPRRPVSAPRPKKAAASQRAPAGKPVEEAKASHPMETRKQVASRAGSLRSGSGLGSMDTCVDLFNPSKT